MSEFTFRVANSITFYGKASHTVGGQKPKDLEVAWTQKFQPRNPVVFYHANWWIFWSRFPPRSCFPLKEKSPPSSSNIHTYWLLAACILRPDFVILEVLCYCLANTKYHYFVVVDLCLWGHDNSRNVFLPITQMSVHFGFVLAEMVFTAEEFTCWWSASQGHSHTQMTFEPGCTGRPAFIGLLSCGYIKISNVMKLHIRLVFLFFGLWLSNNSIKPHYPVILENTDKAFDGKHRTYTQFSSVGWWCCFFKKIGLLLGKIRLKSICLNFQCLIYWFDLSMCH